MKVSDKTNSKRAMKNEIRRLFKGVGDIEGTDTCLFIHRHEVPQYIKVPYRHILCDIIPQKKETHRVKLTVDGNILTYTDPVSTPTAYLTISKIHWNSVVSTPDGKYFIVDVKNFYLKIQLKGENIKNSYQT